MKSEQRLILASAALARSSPQNWREFLASVAEFVAETRTNLVQSPLDTIQRAQGMAQNAAALEKLFNECLSRADQLARKP